MTGAPSQPSGADELAAVPLGHLAHEASTAAAEATGPGAATGLAVDAGVAELVVRRTLLAIRQHFVGLFGLRELLLRLRIIRIPIWVVLHCQSTIGFLQVTITRLTPNPEHIVIIPLSHYG